MYKLKPLHFTEEHLEIHNTFPFYKLKSIHEKVVNDFNKFDKDLNDDLQLSDQEIALLIKKQNEVLKTLEQLEIRLSKLDIQFTDTNDVSILNDNVSNDFVSISKNQSDSLTPCLVNTNNLKISESKNNNDISNIIKTDIVIFANPEDPPYSLLALPILWPAVSWDISYHVHSSITKDLKVLKTFELFKNVSCKDNMNTVKVFVIWKQISPSPEIVRSSTETLIGEVSLLHLFDQYFSNKKLVAIDQSKSNQIWDLINEINLSTNDRSSTLYNLINISNIQLNIVNIVVWLLLHKNNKTSKDVENQITTVFKIIFSLFDCSFNITS